MKAKKIISTDKDPKVVLEMSEQEAKHVFDILASVVKTFDRDGFESPFWGEERDVAAGAEYFNSLLGLR